MADNRLSGPRVGRILTSGERSARMANEAAFAIENEVLRSAFSISPRHVLTAWHCVRDSSNDFSSLWFRVRGESSQGRAYIYIPIYLTNYDELFDVAALAVDVRRLEGARLTRAVASEVLSQACIPLGVAVHDNDQVQVMGFPESASSADSDTNSATVVDTVLPLGDATGLKIFGPAFAAVSPVEPHGLSGGCVLKQSHVNGEPPYVAVGVIRAVPTGSIAGIASGGCLIATRIEDLDSRIPEVSAAVSRTTRSAPKSVVPSRYTNALSVSRSCWQKLRDTLVVVEDPALGKLVGWPHFFNEPLAHRRPTAIGTAFGLKLTLVLGGYEYGPERSGLATTLWKLRREDGGWAARTGTGVSRPEVSALVLGALASTGFDESQRASADDALESALAESQDPVALQRTYIVSAVMRGLIRSRPTSARLAQLRAVLLSGAIQDPRHGNLLCWASRLATEDGEAGLPSVAHTAQAVVALIRASYVLGEEARTHNAVLQSVRWLKDRQDLGNQTEQIRRYVRDNEPWETLTVRHFTAAWVARALLLVPGADVLAVDGVLEEAMHRVRSSCHDGLWEWDDGDRPLWMTYQGASVLRDYAMRSSVIPL